MLLGVVISIGCLPITVPPGTFESKLITRVVLGCICGGGMWKLVEAIRLGHTDFRRILKCTPVVLVLLLFLVWRLTAIGESSIVFPYGDKGLVFQKPIPLLITMLLPLAIGPFNSFRFRLWHYFAYTALVAIQLAYLVEWQELADFESAGW
jgi:hypothetical protein